MESEIPGGIPRVLPLVGHGDHIAVEHVEPLRIAHVAANGLEQWMTLVLAQPALQVEVVVLLAPEHSRECLSVDASLIFVERFGRNTFIELVSVSNAAVQCLLETAEHIF